MTRQQKDRMVKIKNLFSGINQSKYDFPISEDLSDFVEYLKHNFENILPCLMLPFIDVHNPAIFSIQTTSATISASSPCRMSNVLTNAPSSTSRISSSSIYVQARWQLKMICSKTSTAPAALQMPSTNASGMK